MQTNFFKPVIKLNQFINFLQTQGSHCQRKKKKKEIKEQLVISQQVEDHWCNAEYITILEADCVDRELR